MDEAVTVGTKGGDVLSIFAAAQAARLEMVPVGTPRHAAALAT